VEIVAASLVMLLAGFVQGTAGFGAGLVAMAGLTLFWPVPYAVGVTSVLSMSLSIGLGAALRKQIDTAELLPMALFTLPGVVLGVGLLRSAPSNLLLAGLGVVLVVVALRELLGADPPPIHKCFGPVAGMAGGILGGALNTSGPPVIVYGLARRWDKDRFRATLQGYFTITSLTSVTLYALSGIVNEETLFRDLALFPSLLLGAAVGNRLSRHIDAATFRRGVVIALLGMGVLDLVRAI
jgi:uncharacterized protein